MDHINPGSFRDPSGFLFHRGEKLYRQVNRAYQHHYDLSMNSGLFQTLVENKLLINHREADIPFADPDHGYKIIEPEQVPFISYPYEWSFSQLKDAALATLEIQKKAFEKGMCLKDSSAYNIQFYNGKPIFIDTLSFEEYKEGEPWVAYRQFCQHFLAPLALMSLKDPRLGQLLRVYIDGIPLDLAASLLPSSARFKLSLYMHLFLHSKSQKRYENTTPGKTKTPPAGKRKLSRMAFRGIIESLESAVKKLAWTPEGTEWNDYYNDTNYSTEGFNHKKSIVEDFIKRVSPRETWDLGANNGLFSRISSDKGIPTIAFDIDPSAVEKNYLAVKEKKETHILPLLLDLTNPSPGIGWNNHERASFPERGPVDLILSLALIHHLAISNNVPLAYAAAFFHSLCRYLIIEFVPKQDSQVQRLLSGREDIFPNYNRETFERDFSKYFEIVDKQEIKDSLRTLYLLKKKS